MPASDFNPQADNNNFIINLCAKLKCDTYAALPEVYEHNWVNRTVIEKKSIQTEIFQSFPGAHILQSHKQLSAITFLMQFGPEADYLLRQFSAHKQDELS